MWTLRAIRLEPDDYVAALCLRLALLIGAKMPAMVAGPWLYGGIGVAATMSAVGLPSVVAALIGFVSAARHDRRVAGAPVS